MPTFPKDLPSWLRYIESLHPQTIALELTRVKPVCDALALRPKFPIISVTGTNGKGSSCAMLVSIYRAAGYRVACYTSPHLLCYNERVSVNGRLVSDAKLCQAFEAVEKARQHLKIALTYFEMGTLAAMWHFMRCEIDLAVLEVGMGGRLDAVNLWNADVAIVTSIGLDHQAYLGTTRDEIGAEKAGIYRPLCPAICGDLNPPHSLMHYAEAIGADLQLIGRDFVVQSNLQEWHYLASGIDWCLPRPNLIGEVQLNNAACVISAVRALTALPVTLTAIREGLCQIQISGRFERIAESPTVIVDVTHNPHAAIVLAENLRTSFVPRGHTYAVFAMLSDKDIAGVVRALSSSVDIWYVANIDDARGASADTVATIIGNECPHASIFRFKTPVLAYQQALLDLKTCVNSSKSDKILVCGSFFTVSAVMRAIKTTQPVRGNIE